MRCNELVSKLDVYFDDDLVDEDRRALEHHTTGCSGCRGLFEARLTLGQALVNLPVEEPSENFFEQALDTATDGIDPHNGWIRTRQAIAAVAAVLLITVALQTSIVNPSSDIPEVTITLHEVTPVNLRFASVADLKDARISLQLPEGVEIAGYTGRQALSWQTDLQEGENLLQLPLVGYTAMSEVLIAELEHPEGSKTFELQITVN